MRGLGGWGWGRGVIATLGMPEVLLGHRSPMTPCSECLDSRDHQDFKVLNKEFHCPKDQRRGFVVVVVVVIVVDVHSSKGGHCQCLLSERVAPTLLLVFQPYNESLSAIIIWFVKRV